ncbi:hypothetical protein [Robiginitalea marina]|uniref:Lipoprotein n=1 Tax=Robiginitalea marina TaxID=2954105 RepID=A0ABT1AWL5_9FLAO|nr:hypothetical protein [Robiginitalea marina]MCO5724314.1 hypothetical protein [Robiginitalea marina]
MKRQIVLFFALAMFSACNKSTKSNATQQPTLADYRVGEKWVWKYKGVTTQGEIRSEGEDTREIVSVDGELGMTIGTDTIPVADMVKPDESETPKYDWPLEVGKKWKFENSWTSQDGTKGTQSQDVEVLSFQEETVEAGTFMAYKIQYKGTISNSRGYSADTDEVWWYAPEVKNFIKLTQTQEDFFYEEELIEYSKPQ